MDKQFLSKDDFLQKLKELSSGLFYMSESDYPLEIISFSLNESEVSGNELPVSTKVLEIAGSQKYTSIKTENLDHLFRNMLNEEMVGEETATRFKILKSFLEDNLNNLHVYRLGEIEVKVFILGNLEANEFTGLKTKIIQT